MSPLFLGLSINGIVLSSDLIAPGPFRFQATCRSTAPNILDGLRETAWASCPRHTNNSLRATYREMFIQGPVHMARKTDVSVAHKGCVRGLKRR